MTDPILRAIADTRSALEQNADAHWIIGFSGGKDSTALLKIFVSALRKANCAPAVVDIIYCDTGVENLALDRYVKSLFENLGKEFQAAGEPFRTNVLMAPVQDRFFVKVIGRGYPPPTNSFRWCTKNLRIRPVSNFIRRAASENAIVALGMRNNESEQRNRSLKRGGGGLWQTQIEGNKRYRLFLPIIDLGVAEVWDAIFMLPKPTSVNPRALEHLYRGAAGECPVIKSPQAAPCASGRFGCWTCTVVRQDRSSRALIDAGHIELKPYLELRDWLAHIRNDQSRRWPVRRNGSAGSGPFTLAARAEILARIDGLERETAAIVLSPEERSEIERLWILDRTGPNATFA